jgi:hypothetical protein
MDEENGMSIFYEFGTQQMEEIGVFPDDLEVEEPEELSLVDSHGVLQ